MRPTLDLSGEEHPCGESGGRITLVELLKLQESGQFPDESVKIEGSQILCVDTQTY